MGVFIARRIFQSVTEHAVIADVRSPNGGADGRKWRIVVHDCEDDQRRRRERGVQEIVNQRAHPRPQEIGKKRDVWCEKENEEDPSGRSTPVVQAAREREQGGTLKVKKQPGHARNGGRWRRYPHLTSYDGESTPELGSQFAAQKPVERVRPAATQRDGEEEQSPQQQ
jgi:hypothetical protein